MRRITLSLGMRTERTSRPRSVRPRLEVLEDRIVPSIDAAVPVVAPGVELLSSSAVTVNGAPGQPSGLSPAQIGQAYGFNRIAFNNGSIKGDGSGQTIAIVDGYNQPNIASDLQTFDSTYGLPAPPSFKVVNENGGSSLPAASQSWGLEISLDVEWAHAIAPGANILLVEANSASYSDLMTAVNYARNQPGVSVVSMSWGSSEWSGESFYDSYFTTPAGHPGITFIASSGDNGTVEYPSTSPNVLTVGGTRLSTDASGNYLGETAWSGSGGGISTVEAQPSYQQGVVTQTSSYRAVPDVAYNASSNSPYAVYDTSSYNGWIEAYGTSAGTPQWAALVAIADQGRALNGLGSLDGGTQTLPALYQLPQSDFHDISSGGNGSYSAGPGYDLVTGRGSPLANLVVDGLVSFGNSEIPPWVVTPASAAPSTVTGTTTNLSVLGGDDYNASALIYTWSVVAEPYGAEAPTFSVNASNAAQNTLVAFHAAGNYTFQATITNIYGLSVTSTVNVTVNQTPSSISLTPAGGSLNDNSSLQFSAAALDQFGQPMSIQPSWNWSLGGGGALNGSGLFTAPAAGSGTATVYVSGDGLTQAATVAFTAPPSSSPPPPPGQILSIWLQFIESWISQLSQVQSMWQLLAASRPNQ
ncbi:MAG: S53 family peptidase [Gemmataceae bacterium]